MKWIDESIWNDGAMALAEKIQSTRRKICCIATFSTTYH